MFDETTTYLTYTYTYIVGGKEVHSSVEDGKAKEDSDILNIKSGEQICTYGLPTDTKISYAGNVFVNSSVSPEDKTHGIPVDVLISSSKKDFILDAAKHLLAAAPLNELDDNGNLKQVPDSKAWNMAKNCMRYACMLGEVASGAEDPVSTIQNGVIPDYKKDGSNYITQSEAQQYKAKNKELEDENKELEQKTLYLEKVVEWQSSYIADLQEAIDNAGLTPVPEPENKPETPDTPDTPDIPDTPDTPEVYPIPSPEDE